MTNVKALLVAAVLPAALVGGAGAALAGGLGEPQADTVVVAPVAPAPAPGGDWTGFYAGAQLGYADVDSNDAGLDGDDILGGLHGGYRYDFGQAVIGAEIDYDFADIELGDGLGSLDSVARAKLMAGADLGRTLVYGTAGYAYATADVVGTDLEGDGYFLGVGATYAMNDRFTLGGEVLFHTFDDFDDSGVDIDATTLTARASFRF